MFSSHCAEIKLAFLTSDSKVKEKGNTIFFKAFQISFSFLIFISLNAFNRGIINFLFYHHYGNLA